MLTKSKYGFFPHSQGRPGSSVTTYALMLDSCPITKATAEDWRAIELGRLHAADERMIDLEHSAHVPLTKVLIASGEAKAMKLKMTLASLLSQAVGAL